MVEGSAMRKTIFLAVLFCSLFSTGCAQSKPQTHRKLLDRPQEIQGYPCAKGYAWFFADERLSRCTVTREIAFGEARISAGSYIGLHPDGTPNIVQMSHAAPILGVTCMGGSFLGTGEGPMVAFYPSGKLEGCYLAGNQTVQGVPCMNGGIFGDGPGSGVRFYQNGKLKSCKLTKDFGTQRRGDRFVQDP
jgi:hypothetical protein